jgi:hypothetical protein
MGGVSEEAHLGAVTPDAYDSLDPFATTFRLGVGRFPVHF